MTIKIVRLSYKQIQDLLNDNNKSKFKLIFGVDLKWDVMSPLHLYLLPFQQQENYLVGFFCFFIFVGVF